MKMPPDSPLDCLRRLGETGEGPYDIALAALMLGSLDHPHRALEPFRAHLQEVAEKAALAARLAVSAEDGARCIADLLAGRYGYDGDRLSYDDPQNANLISVIERRRGMPVALGILYIHAARASGFEAAGLNSPEHFLLRIGLKGNETLIDPFNGGAALELERFRAPPRTHGISAEEAQVMQPVSDAEVLLRLQNNIKVRALQKRDTRRAVEIVQRMVLFAPKRAELWMELAHFNEEEGALSAARKAYDTCLMLAKSGTALHNEAAFGLQGLKLRLN